MAFSQPAAPLAQRAVTRVDRSAWRQSASMQPRLCQLDGAGATCNTGAGRIRQVREIEAGGLRERRGVAHVIDHDSAGPAGIVVDNVGNTTTFSQASSLYFSNLSNTTCTGVAGGACAIKLTQSGLH